MRQHVASGCASRSTSRPRRPVLRLGVALACAIGVAACGGSSGGAGDDSQNLCSGEPPAFEAVEPPYTRETLATRGVPPWYEDAKLGILIHWGLYSVPAWADTKYDPEKIFSDLPFLLANIEDILAHMPYVAWYQNTLAIEGSPTQAYHAEHFGADFPYENFRPLFEEEAAKWDPIQWADLFRDAGARYVVLVTKHHDGYALWPSAVENANRADWHSSRDLVGDLAAAVRSRCMRMGLYYSGGIDWTFRPPPIATAADFLNSTPPGDDYAAYADAQWRELIELYKPAVLWNDIRYPDAADGEQLFADYYNTVSDGVVNDRWASPRTGALLHHDFITPEYSTLDEILPDKWETVRGIGRTFAYNRNQKDEDYASPEAFVHLLVDVVSKNGNLLLGVGPMADGTVPPPQVEILRGLGAWLEKNGEAIYGTRPWERFGTLTGDGTEVRFTRNPETGVVYATILGRTRGASLRIEDFAPTPSSVRLVGSATPLDWSREGNALRSISRRISRTKWRRRSPSSWSVNESHPHMK